MGLGETGRRRTNARSNFHGAATAQDPILIVSVGSCNDTGFRTYPFQTIPSHARLRLAVPSLNAGVAMCP